MIPWCKHLLCTLLGHQWRETGGRQCPRDPPATNCSQPVFRCSRCATWDHGEKHGPAAAACNVHGINCPKSQTGILDNA